jgi:peptidoglycan/xylan/chitin deacetylase (PgdA/CDA1 family)
MFLTGQYIRLFPEGVRRMAADGHEIANHLDTHPHLTTYAQNRRQQTLPGVTREYLLEQLRRTEASFHRLTGLFMAPFWRAPFGEHNAEIRAWAAEAGYRHISWTQGAGRSEDLDTRDWVADRSSRIYRSREEIAARILEFGRGQSEGLNGGVILMHLATHRQTDRPHESLPEILQTLQGVGYRLVTISELVAHLEPRQARLAPNARPARGRESLPQTNHEITTPDQPRTHSRRVRVRCVDGMYSGEKEGRDERTGLRGAGGAAPRASRGDECLAGRASTHPDPG